jgi:plastocyanin
MRRLCQPAAARANLPYARRRFKEPPIAQTGADGADVIREVRAIREGSARAELGENRRFTRISRVVAYGAGMRALISLMIAAAAAAPAQAADLVVALTTPAGKPVANAVVMVRPQAGAPKAASRLPGPFVMAQKDMQFEPFVLVVPVGAEVRFPNRDPFRHHVYSFSPAKTFELKLYGRDELRAVRFDKAGVVVLGCNIHDNMSAYIRVVDTPFAAKSGADGLAEIRDLPPGAATLTVWQPFLKAKGAEIVREISAPASGTVRLAMTAELRNPPLRRGGY